jgi:hypothetical protein
MSDSRVRLGHRFRGPAHRGALLEAEGERTKLKLLEDAAKARPTKKKQPPKKPNTSK